MSNFKEIEALFAELLIEGGSELTNSERSEIQDYVNAGEYGLALRTTVAIFREERKAPTQKEKSLCLQLAVAMSIPPATLVFKVDLPQGG